MMKVKRNPFFALLGNLGVIFCFTFWPILLVLRRIFFLPRYCEDWMTHSCASWITKCLAITPIIENREIYDPTEKAVIISNHSSLMDIPMIYMACSSRLRMIGKQELFWIPVMGWGMIASRHVPVKRNKRASAAKAKELLASRLNMGYQIYLAPEGTRSAKGCLLPFKSGAFRIAHEQGVPIYALGLYKPWELLPKGKMLPPYKGEICAKFLGKIEPKSKNGHVKKPEELLKEARGLFLQNGFSEC